MPCGNYLIGEGKEEVRVGVTISSVSWSSAVFVIRMSWGGPMAARRCERRILRWRAPRNSWKIHGIKQNSGNILWGSRNGWRSGAYLMSCRWWRKTSVLGTNLLWGCCREGGEEKVEYCTPPKVPWYGASDIASSLARNGQDLCYVS